MANPAWFFSTLAQASAAIVGFIITVSTVQYQLEKQRRQARTEDLRKSLMDFKRKYDKILPEITGQFADGAYKLLGMSPGVHLLPNHIIDGLVTLEAQNPNQSLVWTHLSRVSTLTTFQLEPSSNPEEHYLFSDDEFDSLIDSIEWLDENFKENTDTIENLYRELGIDHHSKPYLADEFDPDPPEESIQEWLNEHQPYTSQSPSVFSGENLQSYRRVIEEMNNDVEELDALRKNTVLNFDPHIFKVLRVSGLLVVVGVLLPSAALVSDVPAVISALELSGAHLFLYQSVLLLASAGLTLYLLLVLVRNLQRQ